MTFEEACARYVHRYTMEHVPAWARQPVGDGRWYAPQYSTDRDWYNSTLFPPDNPYDKKACHSTNQTWPLGDWLDKPYTK